jgi:hypothetical protein
MDEIALKLALEFLGLDDALRCSVVCNDWRHSVLMNDDVWKQAATNDLPEVMDVISGRQNLNYRNIAMGLIYKPQEEEDIIGDDGTEKVQSFQAPDDKCDEDNLKVEDILLVVELKDKKSGKSIGTWCNTFTNFMATDKGINHSLSLMGTSICQLPVRLEGSINDHFDEWWMTVNGALADLVPTTVYNSLAHTVRLIRLDTSQHYCVCYEADHPYSEQELKDMLLTARREVFQHRQAFLGREPIDMGWLPSLEEEITILNGTLNVPVLRLTEAGTASGHRVCPFHMDFSMRLFPDPDNYWHEWREARYLLANLKVELKAANNDIRETVLALDGLDWK